MTRITVKTVSEQDPMTFQVTVADAGGSTRHAVTLSTATWRRLGAGETTPTQCVEAAFRFLLDREPKESILERFDLTLIAHYFPEFDRKLADYLPR